MKRLFALFDASPAYVQSIIDRMNAKTGSPALVEVAQSPRTDGRRHAVVTGRNQDVMHVIGAVADEGEDFLIGVMGTP